MDMPPFDPPGDNALSARVASFLDRNRPRLLEHARWLARGRPSVPDPEDTVQDAQLKLYRWLTAPGRDVVEEGLYTLARQFVETSFHDLLKVQGAKKRGGGRMPAPIPPTGLQPAAALPGPITNAVRDERRVQLRRALEGIDELDRRIVLLRIDQDLSFAEIGSAVGLSEDAARMRFTRSLKSLRPLLEPRTTRETRR